MVALGSPPTVETLGDDHWRIGDVEFVHGYAMDSSPDRFFIRKDQSLIDRYVDLASSSSTPSIVELGVAAGGGAALLSLLFRPRLLIAIELDPDPVAALEEFRRQRGLSGSLRPHYGVDQADRPTLRRIVDEALDGSALDLVFDDASHLYGPTVASFETLFPRLRPGGWFVIEDWEWSDILSRGMHARMAEDESVRDRIIEHIERGDHTPGPPLSLLALELVLARAVRSAAVGEIRADRHWVMVERGDADLDDGFRLRDLYHDDFGLLAPAAGEAVSGDDRA